MKKVTEKEYLDNLDISILIQEEYSKSFAFIEFRERVFKIAWNGNLEPETLLLEKYKLFLIGAGDTVVAICTESYIIKFCMSITDSFSFFKETETGFLITGEMTIFIINGYNCSIHSLQSVPNIIVDIKITSGKLIVECMEGETYEIS